MRWMGVSAKAEIGLACACIAVCHAPAASADVSIVEKPDAITIRIEGKITAQDFNRLDANPEQLRIGEAHGRHTPPRAGVSGGVGRAPSLVLQQGRPSDSDGVTPWWP